MRTGCSSRLHSPSPRRIIYTTNAIESLNFKPRKIIKNRGHFPTDDAVMKLLWLAIRDIEDKRARARAKEKGAPRNERKAPPNSSKAPPSKAGGKPSAPSPWPTQTDLAHTSTSRTIDQLTQKS